MKLNICIIGMGYVGCANGLVLAQKNSVTLVDTQDSKVKNFNNGKLPIEDCEGAKFLKKNKLDIKAVNSLDLVDSKIDFYVLALPTDFNKSLNSYDTSSIENILDLIFSRDNNSKVVIKSTVNIGFTSLMRKKFNSESIYFSPEFLREGTAFKDNLFPSRIIVGDSSKTAKDFANLLLESSHSQSVKALFMSPEAAESVKLFSNSYLAMRVAFFNELDTFCQSNDIDPLRVIEGVSSDPRIGMFYNNPSFGFGGYCLPKDTMQLQASFDKVPQKIINAIIESNEARKSFIVSKILEKNPKIVGIFSLSMKSGSNNFRDSAVLDIMKALSHLEKEIIVFDSYVNSDTVLGFSVCKNFKTFIEKSDIVLANRFSSKLEHIKHKVFTRDIFNSDI